MQWNNFAVLTLHYLKQLSRNPPYGILGALLWHIVMALHSLAKSYKSFLVEASYTEYYMTVRKVYDMIRRLSPRTEQLLQVS
jgi:hypothetical protein